MAQATTEPRNSKIRKFIIRAKEAYKNRTNSLIKFMLKLTFY